MQSTQRQAPDITLVTCHTCTRARPGGDRLLEWARCSCAPRPEGVSIRERGNKDHKPLRNDPAEVADELPALVHHGLAVPQPVRQLQPAAARAAPHSHCEDALRWNYVAAGELMHARRVSGAVELLRENVEGRERAAGEDDAVRLLQRLGMLRARVQQNVLQVEAPCTATCPREAAA